MRAADSCWAYEEELAWVKAKWANGSHCSYYSYACQPANPTGVEAVNYGKAILPGA